MGGVSYHLELDLLDVKDILKSLKLMTVIGQTSVQVTPEINHFGIFFSRNNGRNGR